MPASAFIRNLRRKIGTELLQLPTVSVLIFDHGGRILLVRHMESDVWSTPGGIVEPYETPGDAALREVWEETGLWVNLERILGVFGGDNCATVYPNGDRISWISTVFEATIISGEPRPDNEETAEVRYFSKADLRDLACAPHVDEFLAAVPARSAGAYFQAPVWKPAAASGDRPER